MLLVFVSNSAPRYIEQFGWKPICRVHKNSRPNVDKTQLIFEENGNANYH